MSALSRYFNLNGYVVAGYDKTPTELTNNLLSEGIRIHFSDNPEKIPAEFKTKENTLIVYTPAIPKDHSEFNYFKNEGFFVVKRSLALGMLVNEHKGIGIAGTHGKTTVSTMVSHLLKNSQLDCSAFLGGISKNYASNYLLSKTSPYVVVEADEFDRSFLQLNPGIAVITSIDPDHLDIYKNHQEIIDTFNQFVARLKPEGVLIVNKKVEFLVNKIEGIHIYSYSLDEKADFYAENIELDNGLYKFSLVTPRGTIDNIKLGIPGKVNLENAVSALAVSLECGAKVNELRSGLVSFKGVKRRMDVQFNHPKMIYIDDYAHHPEELKKTIASVKEMYAGKQITGIFQPHLFSRTNNFYKEFAQSLDLLDQSILLDIYPAREIPIPGVTSDLIYREMHLKNKQKCSKNKLIGILKEMNFEVLLTLGAGDIDTLVPEIVLVCKNKTEKLAQKQGFDNLYE